jgi:hypothetical protein
MDGISYIDLRGRVILIFRMLKVDTIVTFNPWGHAEENPDHWVTGRAVEEASWMAAGPNGRPGQPYNRVVDIGSHIEKKIDALVECRLQADGNRGSVVRSWRKRDGACRYPASTTGSTASRTTFGTRSDSITSIKDGRPERRRTNMSRRTRWRLEPWPAHREG